MVKPTKHARMKAKPVKKTKKVKRLSPGSKALKGGLAAAMKAEIKASAGRKDISFEQAGKVACGVFHSVPIEQRAGFPLVLRKGTVHPKDWTTVAGVKIMVDFKRAYWLPDEWGQGVKPTQPTAHSKPGGAGGTYTVFIAPDGKNVFYHQSSCEEFAGKKFTQKDGFNGLVRQAKLEAQQSVQLARAELQEHRRSGGTGSIGLNPDSDLFGLLNGRERKCLPSVKDVHFCVVSARRATSKGGIQDIFTLQSQLEEAGVTPTWYVDADSLKDYLAIGLKAKVGGKLTPARNMCLDDAKKLGKACVQMSDDISVWSYRHGPVAKKQDFPSINKAHDSAKVILMSPVCAARFIIAKMRGVDGPQKPKLGGVYCLGSCSQMFQPNSKEFSTKHFIIGDFLVTDVERRGEQAPRFDVNMKLKEDYDFTCKHIRAHGGVMRCNRMTINAKHYANEGGAVSERDAKGKEERRNVDILFSRWPRAFSVNPKRKSAEVVLKWPADDDVEDKAGKFKSFGKGWWWNKKAIQAAAKAKGKAGAMKVMKAAKTKKKGGKR